MHPQLQDIEAEFLSAQDRLNALAQSVAAEHWRLRGDPARWSVGECVAHLNLTSRAYLPVLDDAATRARALGGAPPGRYRRDFAGWALWRSLGPPARFRFKTPPSFVPEGTRDPRDLVAEFTELQTAQLGYLRASDGLPLASIKVASPFEARMHYNLFACFRIIPRHQHRHLWQAEQVWKNGKPTT